jgi:hypothetical protein
MELDWKGSEYGKVEGHGQGQCLEAIIPTVFSSQRPDENVRLFLMPMTRRLQIVAILYVVINVEHQSIRHSTSSCNTFYVPFATTQS